MVRLAFCGASGTGKTTLAKWMSEEFDLPFNPVGSRSVAKSMGFDNPYDVDEAGMRGEFQRELVRQKRAWEDEHESFVTDRTTLDNLTYTMFHGIYSIDAALLDAIVGGLKRYTHIVICPVSAFIKIGDDPHRVGGGKYEADDTYHRLFDITLRALLIKFRDPKGCRVTVLGDSELDRRQEAVREFIQPL